MSDPSTSENRDSAGRQPILLCSCEETMQPDLAAIAQSTGTEPTRCRQLCGSELDRFRAAAKRPGEVIVGCTQMRHLFLTTAERENLPATLRFANIRETAGWSTEGAAAGPKMAALLAAATVPTPDVPPVTLESAGVTLVYGRGEVAVAAALRLQAKLDVTLILIDPSATPPHRAEFPIGRGRARNARGHLGAFEVTLDGFALAAPSSRDRLVFGAPRDGAVSRCDILVDLSGEPPLFPAHELRPGYLRADPGTSALVERLLFDAVDLVGTFDKPRYVDFKADLCAHSRSRITGCTRCLDLCPTGAITPAGDSVGIDAAICAGCGACAAICPTGAAGYALPPADVLMARVRKALLAYSDAGGSRAVLLLHDETHGVDLVDALARHGAGLPAHVIPLQVNEVTQIGPSTVAAALAHGAAGVRLLTRERPRHDIEGLRRTVALMEDVAVSQGFAAGSIQIVDADDPDVLSARLRDDPIRVSAAEPSRFMASGRSRQATTLALRELHRVAPVPAPVVALQPGAPFGRVEVDEAGCTLCLSCVSACPTSALGDNPDRPMLRFDESLCVQCGLCAATCPEKVITLEPRLNFPAFGAPPVVLKQEDPFNCVSCGKAFGTRSTIERITAKLAGHWMYSGANAGRLDVVRMCDDCRVDRMVQEKADPYAGPERPRVRTTDDYLRERALLEGKDPLGEA